MEFIDFVIGISVCFILSFILGIERQYRRRSLGLRTMILVAIGSYMFVSFSFLITGYQLDVSRVAAQVVTGIGFLGAGVIVKNSEKNRVSGLTTAATLWCDASIGMLCAGRFIKEAIVGALFVLFANIVLREVNKIINNRTTSMATKETFRVSFSTDNKDVVKYINDMFKDDNAIDTDNFKVDEDTINFDIIVKKSSEKKVDSSINDIVTKFNIKKYEYKKIEEILLEENDEL